MESRSFVFCCTMREVGAFRTDDAIMQQAGDVIDDIKEDNMYNEGRKKKVPSLNEAMTKVLKCWYTEPSFDGALAKIATTSDQQMMMRNYMVKEKGWKILGTYKGHQGMITLLGKGLTVPRKRK